MRNVQSISVATAMIVVTMLLATAARGGEQDTSLQRPAHGWVLDASLQPTQAHWGDALRQSATQDVANWAIRTTLSPVVPSTLRNFYTGVGMIHGLTPSPVRTPVEALDKLRPLSTLGGLTGVGSSSGLLLPFLKGYYGLVFDQLDAIDASLGVHRHQVR